MPNLQNNKWMESPQVLCYTSNLAEEDYNEQIDINKVAWFNIKLKIGETDREKKEHTAAIQEQIQLGVVQPNGIPFGVQMPPQRPQRTIQAPIRNPFTQPNASPLMKKVGQQLNNSKMNKRRYIINTKRK